MRWGQSLDLNSGLPRSKAYVLSLAPEAASSPKRPPSHPLPPPLSSRSPNSTEAASYETYSSPAWLLICSKLRRLEALAELAACGSGRPWHVFDLKVLLWYLFSPCSRQLILPAPSIGFWGVRKGLTPRGPHPSACSTFSSFGPFQPVSAQSSHLLWPGSCEHVQARPSHLILTTSPSFRWEN